MRHIKRLQMPEILQEKHTEWQTVTDAERRSILAYMSPDQPYSLMCEIFLKTHYAWLIV